MPQTKRLVAPLEFKDADEGSVTARFSVFDVPDRDGDIVRRSAFSDGQQVPMVWSHDWDHPIGKGVIRVEADHALFEGKFFATTAGQEARATVREMGELQQWSWGFRVTETQDNDTIRGMDITGAEVFEVSPVLVGANQRTATLAVKAEKPDADQLEPTNFEVLVSDATALAERERDGDDVAEDVRALAAAFDELAKSYEPAPDPADEIRKQLALAQMALEAIALKEI